MLGKDEPAGRPSEGRPSPSNEERTRLLVESVADYAIIMLDPDGRVTSWNAGAERINGYRAEEIVGKHFSVFYLHEAREQAHPQHELEVAKRTGRYEEEGWRLRKDGTTFWANVVITSIHDQPTGALLGFAKVTRDLTERRRNEELARELLERTQALADLKTQFFARVSHELRTPLSLILGPAERALHAVDTPAPIRGDLQLIVRNARLLLRQVNDLLDVAKLEARQMRPDYEECDIANLARFVAGHFELLCKDKSIAFEIEAPASLVIDVDTDKLQRVLMNLLSNSFRFTPPGGCVRLTLYALEDCAHLEVADSGPGIPVEKRQEVFAVFRQLEGESSSRFGGTGLGLAIARELTTLHGGAIEVCDAPEGGALFLVELPRAAPAGAAVRRPKHEAVRCADHVDRAGAGVRQQIEELRAPWATPVAPSTRTDGALVLVAEDNAEMNRFLCESLASHYRVVTSFDGNEALRKACDNHPDLILSDISMPGMNGDELVRALRLRSDLDRVPIVLLTARADDELRARLLSEGAQDYVTKPVMVAELRARIDNLISSRRLEQALRMAEARSSGILSISADALISVDSQQRITMFNEGAEKIFGFSKSEVMSAPLDMLLPERFRHRHRHHVEKFAGGADAGRGVDQRGELRMYGLRKNGEEFPAEASISKLEVGGEVVLTVRLRDTTDLHRTQREQRFLAELGRRLATTLEYDETVALICELAVGELGDFASVDVVDQEGTVRRSKVLARHPAKAKVAEAFMRIGLDRSRPHLIWPVVETKTPILIERVTDDALEAWARSADDLRAIRALEVRSAIAVPLLAQRELIGVLSVISSTRTYQKADLRLAQQLAERASLALENARLYRAARTATEARDQFLGVVAHDLRNPLNAIFLQARLLHAPPGEHDRRSAKPADRIERAARRMNRLIQDLLDLARMDLGQLSVQRTSLQLHALLSEVVDAQRPAAIAATIGLEIQLPPNIPDVLGDRDRLLQVFENLIGNALKFTKPGGSVTIGAGSQRDENLFWVADSGSGIAKDDIAHVFDPFWQAEKTGRRGAGLGLPIVKGIVEAHGGRVWLDSEPGRGTTFFFTIPTAMAAAP